MGPSLFVKEYLNNLNHLEFTTEKKLFRMRRGREVDLQQSRQYNLSKNSIDEDLLIGVSSNSPMLDSMYLKETESSRNRA